MSNNVLPDPLNVNVVSPDPLNVNVVSPDPLPTNPTPKDYFIEVANGNVTGASLEATRSKNLAVVATGFEDVSGFGGVMYPIAPPNVAETFEIRSDDINDTDGGTGVNSMLVISLDADYNEQAQLVAMDGTSWVTVPGTHIRPKEMINGPVGSSATNIGNITIRDIATTNTRNFMAAEQGRSYDASFTVPAGKKAILLQTFTLFGKDDSGEARLRFRLPGADTSWIINVPTPHYQNMLTFKVMALQAFPAKTDINLQAKSDTGTSNVTIVFEYEILDE